jgi:hypothetical protein
MVATGLNRLPSFKSQRTLSLLENEPRERKSNPEKNLSSDREPSANSGLDIETENSSATSRGRTFFVDILFYRTTYLKVRHSCHLSSAKVINRLRGDANKNDAQLSSVVGKIGSSYAANAAAIALLAVASPHSR